ncbi:MAG TPA: hypothetical protein VGQ83_37860 [Polyangia bacterium]|jgi:hypothetical protein
MRKSVLIGFLVIAPAALVGSGSLVSCSSLKCGDNTHEVGGKCVNNAVSPCGEGTVSHNGVCTRIGPEVCGENTKWDGDAGQCIGQGGGPVNPDGGTEVNAAARWTSFVLAKPESIKDIANLQIPAYVADGTIVIMLKVFPATGDSFQLEGGAGVKQDTTDGTIDYTFNNSFKNTSGVVSQVTATYTGEAAGGERPFSASGFNWSFIFLPGQPPLDMRNVTLTGGINQDNHLATSVVAPNGSFSGCITKDSAIAVYIEVLGKTLEQLITANGGVTDCTEGGLEGYYLESTWLAEELVDLVTLTTQTDGGTPTDAATD